MGIRGVDKVVIGVRDQQRAKRFWSETLGFTVTTDAPYDESGARWVEVTSPDGRTRLVLADDPDGSYVFPGEEGMPTANIFLYADDLEATYRELTAKGVEFVTAPVKQPWGWWSVFVDSEGNRYALSQP